MYTINKEYKASIEVDKSKFIGVLFPSSSLDEFNKRLEFLKKEHPKAKHFVYAYIINNEKRVNDDKEPKGSAGLPLLNSLEKNNLTNIAIIIIRYFGGTLLGASRLLRTYVKTFEEVNKLATYLEITKKRKLTIKVNYEEYNTFKNYLKVSNFNIINTSFNDKILIEFIVPFDFNFNKLNESYLGKLSLIDDIEYLDYKEKNNGYKL